MKDYVNLLPWNYRRRCLVRRRLRQWAVAWTVVALALVVGWLDLRAQWETALAQVETHDQRYDEVRSLKGENARLLAQKQGLGKQQDLVVQLQQAPPPLLPVALVSASASRCEGRVAVQHLVYNEEPPTTQPVPQLTPTPSGTQPAIVATANRPPRSARLTVDGIGADNVAVAEFVLGLRDSGVFERVDLKSAAASTTRAGNVTSYQVECGL